MTEWRVLILRPARRYLEKLPYDDRKRILDHLKALEEDPTAVPIKTLKGRPEQSLRVGKYRILMRVDKEYKLIVVTRVGPRGNIYKR